MSVITKDSSGTVSKSVEYTYDAYDRRIAKNIDSDGVGSAPVQTERMVYDRDNIALTFDGNGTQTHRYLHGTRVDKILADETSTGVNWALTDNQGTVRNVIDSQGQVLNHIVYDSYGQVTSETNTNVDFRYGYTGRERDEETGLDYYRTRYYDSLVGRFVSEDTIGFNGGDTNLYRYVANNPVNVTDPFGLEALSAGGLDVRRGPTIGQMGGGGGGGNFSGLGSGRYFNGGGGGSLRGVGPGGSFNSGGGSGSGNQFRPGASGLGGGSSRNNPVGGLGNNPRNGNRGSGSSLGNRPLGKDGGYGVRPTTVPENYIPKPGPSCSLSDRPAEFGGPINDPNGWARDVGILRDATVKKGNFGLGSATRNKADELGRDWVGKDHTVASDGKTLISKDGLRQYRPPTRKPNSPYVKTGTQANFESRSRTYGQWQNNGHLDITE
jgi:RHS repeat-associated protein